MLALKKQKARKENSPLKKGRIPNDWRVCTPVMKAAITARTASNVTPYGLFFFFSLKYELDYSILGYDYTHKSLCFNSRHHLIHNPNMHSLTKTPISQNTVQSVISCHFGSSSLISAFHELTDGFYNSAYFVELTDGKRWVLKIAPNPSIKIMQYEKEILRTEVVVLRLVKSKTDLPVPFVAANDYTHTLLENDYFIMEFIDGIPLNKLRDSLSENEAQAIDERTGYYLRQMNGIEGKRFGYYTQPEMSSNNWREAFTLMLRSVLEDGQSEGVVLPVDYNSVQSQIFEHQSCLEEVQTPRLVHWDLWDGNIFVDPVSKQITGLIDFERALWADPLMEANFGAFGINHSFLNGYGVEMLTTPKQKERRSLYNIYLYLIMIIECYFRKYDTDQQENWARQKLITELEILNSY